MELLGYSVDCLRQEKVSRPEDLKYPASRIARTVLHYTASQGVLRIFLRLKQNEYIHLNRSKRKLLTITGITELRKQEKLIISKQKVAKVSMTCAFEISLFFLLEANILSSKRKFFCLLLDFWLVLNVFRFISLRFAKNRLLKSLFNRYFFLLALYVKC